VLSSQGPTPPTTQWRTVLRRFFGSVSSTANDFASAAARPRAAMGIRWDCLQPVMTAPYVPTLGPAYPAAITPGLFADVIEIAGTRRFLPHDKDRRWADRKDEQILPEAITQEPSLVMIPTLSTRRTSCVKVHIYSQDPRGALSRAAGLCRRLCEERDAGKGRLVWFLPPGSDPDPVAACTRIQMRTFGPGHHAPAPAPGPVPLDEVTGPARATFSALAEKLAAEGFAFLDARIREQDGIGPMLTCQRERRIVGAIGPMEIMPDSRGTARLLPQVRGRSHLVLEPDVVAGRLADDPGAPYRRAALDHTADQRVPGGIGSAAVIRPVLAPRGERR